METIKVNPEVSTSYRDSVSHEMLETTGRARMATADDTQRIAEALDSYLKAEDPGRDGVAVVIDLNRVTGLIHSADTGAIERILMERST